MKCHTILLIAGLVYSRCLCCSIVLSLSLLPPPISPTYAPLSWTLLGDCACAVTTGYCSPPTSLFVFVMTVYLCSDVCCAFICGYYDLFMSVVICFLSVVTVLFIFMYVLICVDYVLSMSLVAGLLSLSVRHLCQ